MNLMYEFLGVFQERLIELKGRWDRQRGERGYTDLIAVLVVLVIVLLILKLAGVI